MTEALTHPLLAALPGVAHGFFTRCGGVSDGIYASLNCGVGSRDDRERVLANRARVAAAMSVAPAALATPYQVHGTDVIHVEATWPAGRGPQADAVVADRPGIAVAVGTADCGPVLFADAEAGVVAAAHAGWRGALAGILGATVDAMTRCGAARHRIVAVLGPTISQTNYEVGDDMRTRVVAAAPDDARWFVASERPGHAMFDLPGYILSRLAEAGVADAQHVGGCTYADEERFFSFRRTTHRDEPDYGRMLSAIVLTG